MENDCCYTNAPPEEPKGMKVEASKRIYLDKHGWPVTKIVGKPVINFIRHILHAKKTKRVTCWYYLR